MMRWFLASGNAHKVAELRALAAVSGLPITIHSAREAGGMPPVVEDSGTFRGNAGKKARALLAVLPPGAWALADDSGLSVAALDGRPGVYTADWAERQWFEGAPGRDWYMAMGKVEGMLAEKGTDVDRSAAFHCVLALAWPEGDYAIYEGACHGSLTWPPRGALGFGYDPVFVADGMDQTFAEIDPEHKHAISHRADAFKKLVAALF